MPPPARTALLALVAWLDGIGAALAQGAPGAPGTTGVWNFAGKTGVGTAYARHLDGQYREDGPTGVISQVWFPIADDIVTETAHGLIHKAQSKDLQFLVVGADFFDEEKQDTLHQIEYLHVDGEGRPLSLAYRVVNRDRDGRDTIEKHVFTDPDRQALFMRVVFTAHTDAITPYLLVNPHVANTGPGDVAYVASDHLGARQHLRPGVPARHPQRLGHHRDAPGRRPHLAPRRRAILGWPDQRLKFDLYDDWSQNFGEDNADGTADPNGADVPVTAGAGAYAVTLDDQTMRYSVVKE